MRLAQTRLNQIKTYVHAAQAVLVVLCIILTIAIFAASGSTDGRTGWFFGLCFLTIPIIIYLTMVPVWSRARKFSNIYAFVALDCLGAVLWLTGWAAVANYVVTGKGKGNVKDASGCANFKYGSEKKCTISQATIFFGVVIMLMFVATAIISFKAVMEFKRTGIMPHGQAMSGGAGPLGGAKSTGNNADDEAFDSNMNLRNDWEVDEYDHDEYHAQGYGARQGAGYATLGMDDHDHDRDDDHHLHHHNQHAMGNDSTLSHNAMNSGLNSSYRDDNDLSTQRPTSTGPGPIGGGGGGNSNQNNNNNTYFPSYSSSRPNDFDYVQTGYHR